MLHLLLAQPRKNQSPNSSPKSLIWLVDSRDIAELQLNQLDCELLIRKKEALPQLQTPALPPMVYQSPVPSNGPPVSSAPVRAPVAAPAPTPSPAPSSLPSPSADSSLPPLKCPMAGTFYRSLGPGEPPFVKVSPCSPLSKKISYTRP
ncbi:hypothetical protein MLD38_036158 [Melastoma candidum]|uniref:Uncharacterized protein n=1 Tax=Melastoma candidum TaxID=119954 RepID=A0ACB9LJE2_9MYRT|nr:hypothetical protein MLD38_036158 [Melastoma candidum]